MAENPAKFGAVTVNPQNIRGMNRIAYYDEQNEQWLAGPDNKKGVEPGNPIDSEYAKKARSSRQRWNAVKSNMKKLGLTATEAHERVQGVAEKLENEKEKEEPDMDRIVELQKKLGGSP